MSEFQQEENTEECPATEEDFAVLHGHHRAIKSTATIEEKLQELDKREHFARKRMHRSHWKRPAIYVYPDNFGFGVNTYQSMIDYLDAKDRGIKVNRDDVHLPLLEERCMRQYSSQRPFKYYSNTDIDRAIQKGSDIVTSIRQNDAVGISNVLNRTHTNYSMTKKYMQSIKSSTSNLYREEHSEFNLPPRRSRSLSPVRESTLVRDVPSAGVRPYSYHSITSLNHLLDPLPTRKPQYIDRLSTEFQSVLDSLSRSRMEYESEMASRQNKLKQLDNKFEDAIDRMYSQIQRISDKADKFDAIQPDKQMLEDEAKLMVNRNRARRVEEFRNMSECIDELTSMDSARNQLRHSLRNLDRETMGISSRVDEMKEDHYRDNHGGVSMDMDYIDSNTDYDHLMAMVDARKRDFKARKEAQMKRQEEELEEEFAPRSRPRQAELYDTWDRVTTRPKQTLMRDEVMSDTLANILRKASEMSDVSSANRRINSRARYINVYKPRPDTADRELIVPPSKTEVNIDFMAKTLAQKGRSSRYFDIDQEIDNPHSNINTNARVNYCERGLLKQKEEYPSLSNRVRYAKCRSRARCAVMGF